MVSYVDVHGTGFYVDIWLRSLNLSFALYNCDVFDHYANTYFLKSEVACFVEACSFKKLTNR